MMILSLETKKAIDTWLLKFPEEQKQSAVLYALQVVQAENGGFLTEHLMDAVAAYLSMPKISVYEVATFYSLYDLKPVGRHKIYFCTNISCMLNGCDKIANHLKKRLGVDWNETTSDGRFTLKESECLAACNVAPMMMIGDTYFENLTPEKVDNILADLE